MCAEHTNTKHSAAIAKIRQAQQTSWFITGSGVSEGVVLLRAPAATDCGKRPAAFATSSCDPSDGQLVHQLPIIISFGTMTVGDSSCYLRSRFTCSPQRGLQCNARPAFCSANGEEQMKSRNLKILEVSAAITTGSLVGAGSSYAHGLYGSKQWVPRRHFVGIKEERRPPKFKVE